MRSSILPIMMQIQYRGLRLIVPQFWQIEIELMRGIGIIEPLRELFYYRRVHFGIGKF